MAMSTTLYIIIANAYAVAIRHFRKTVKNLKSYSFLFFDFNKTFYFMPQNKRGRTKKTKKTQKR